MQFRFLLAISFAGFLLSGLGASALPLARSHATLLSTTSPAELVHHKRWHKMKHWNRGRHLGWTRGKHKGWAKFKR